MFDQRAGILYVSIHQVFALWFIPFYKAPVKLISVLKLTQQSSGDSTSARNDGPESTALAGPGKERARYKIASQEDHYQINDCLQFVLPGLGPFVWFLWQLYSTGLCVIGSVVFLPVYLLLNKNTGEKKAK